MAAILKPSHKNEKMRGAGSCRVKGSHRGIGSSVGRKRGLANVPQFEVGKDASPFLRALT
jgi:hypothetical protein